jgi:coatomer subunit gamma
MTPQAECGLTEDFIIPLPSLTATTSPNIVYVSFTRESPQEYTLATFQCLLKFVSKELDPATGEPEEEGYEDEYQLEEVELSAGGDYIVPSYATFSAEWDRLRGGPSSTETFALAAMESIKGKGLPTDQSEIDIYVTLQLLVILLPRYSIWKRWAGPKVPRRLQCTLCSYLV